MVMIPIAYLRSLFRLTSNADIVTRALEFWADSDPSDKRRLTDIVAELYTAIGERS